MPLSKEKWLWVCKCEKIVLICAVIILFLHLITKNFLIKRTRSLYLDSKFFSQALEAVFEDLEAKGVEECVCLGDIVGYGPNPNECVDLIREKCSVTVKGNHDEVGLSLIHI